MILLTHNDLDAAGCELVIRKKTKPEKVFYEDYCTLEETVREIISYSKQYSIKDLIIADLSFAENQRLLQNLVSHFDRVIHFDHHSYPAGFGVKPKFLYIPVIDPSRCACKIAYDSLGLTDGYLKELTDTIDVFDRWQFDDPMFEEAFNLNRYFWECGYQEFLSRFSERYPKTYFDESETLKQKALTQLQEHKEKGLVLKDRKVTIHFSEDCFFDSLVESLNNEQKGFICVLKYALRIRLSQTFSKEQAESLRQWITGKVTGHPYAFTYIFKGTDRERFDEVKRVSDLINGYC